MKLTDNTISHLAKLIQMAILTGTDIVDHFRMISLIENENNMLDLDKECDERLNDAIKDMLNGLKDD